MDNQTASTERATESSVGGIIERDRSALDPERCICIKYHGWD